MATTNYNIRLDENLRDRAFSVFASYGLSPSQAIKLFLTQVADTHAIPLSFSHKGKEPNAATRAAIAEIEADKLKPHLQRYSSTEEMMADIEAFQE